MKYTDEQYALIEDIKTRKDIARSARYIKNGSKSKKCSLPSDYLTKKEKEAMNGELITVNLNKPITYDEFKSLSSSTKKTYLEHIFAVYNATMKDLGDMWGVSDRMIQKWCSNLNVHRTKNSRFSAKEAELHKNEWNSFLNGEYDKTSENYWKNKESSELEIASPLEVMAECSQIFADNVASGMDSIKEAESTLNEKLKESNYVSSKDICDALGYGVGSEETGWLPKKELTPIHVEDIDETYILHNINKHKQAKKDFRNSLNKYLKSSLDILLDSNHDDSERDVAKFNQLLELYMFDEVRTVVKEKHNDIF